MIGREAAAGERDRYAVEIEQPQDDFFAVERRHGRHAKIERASLSHQTDATVVGQAMLGDVEVRHDLDARDDGGAIADGDDGGLLEQAVDAKAHHHAFGARLEMNVAGAAGEGLVQDRIDDVGDAASLVGERGQPRVRLCWAQKSSHVAIPLIYAEGLDQEGLRPGPALSTFSFTTRYVSLASLPLFPQFVFSTSWNTMWT